MKEITRIHLAKTPFNVEITAKEALQKYLAAIEKALGADDDTMREIEARVVELLAERGVSGEKVIASDDVTAIKDQLGAPSDFVDEDAVAEEAELRQSSERRLMRDTDGGMLGGVCAGVAHYLGISQVWTRLAAVILTIFSFGTGVFVYALLWLIMPPARTAAEKLQMRGESVTLAALKTEAAQEKPASESSKPFVVVLRIGLALMFAMLALGALAAVVMALFGVMPIAIMSDLPEFSRPLIITAFIAAVISGILFISLMALGVYVSSTWRFTKRIGQLSGLLIVAGLITFGAALTTGSIGVNEASKEIERLKTTETRKETDLRGAKSLSVTNAGQQSVRYVVSSGTPRVETDYLKGYAKPKAEFTRSGDKVSLKIEDVDNGNKKCLFGSSYTCVTNSRVTVYGPALESLDVARGEVSYDAGTQSKLLVTTRQDDTSIELLGQIGELSTVVGRDAEVDATEASVGKVDASFKAFDGALELATVRQLAVAASTACGSDQRNNVEVASVEKLTVNGKPVDQRDGLLSPCLTLENNTDDDDQFRYTGREWQD